MSLAAFLAEAVLISLSGVMGPGPMTATAVGKGNDSPHAGALMAIGHGIVELPLMIATFYGLGALFSLAYVKAAIAFVGGVFLLVMAIGMFRNLKLSQIEVQSNKYTRSPIIAGVILSLGNPYELLSSCALLPTAWLGSPSLRSSTGCATFSGYTPSRFSRSKGDSYSDEDFRGPCSPCAAFSFCSSAEGSSWTLHGNSFCEVLGKFG